MVKSHDFASALYLGFHHSSNQLPSWANLTTGSPSLLKESRKSREVGNRNARLMGLERGVLMSSSLHLFWDLFQYLSTKKAVIFRDKESYPISKWMARKAGIMTRQASFQFPHQDVESLRILINKRLRPGYFPLILTDGFCPICGKMAPLTAYANLAQKYGGIVVLDDTQAYGVFGENPDKQMPLGYGGGGSLKWLGVETKNIWIGSSLAKGFGAPLAILSGPSKEVEKLNLKSNVRVHCSPPSTVDILAAERALKVNDLRGDELRKRLLENIRLFKMLLSELGIGSKRSIFPVQILREISGEKAIILHRFLLTNRVLSVLNRDHEQQTRISFIIRADHQTADIEFLGYLLFSFLKKRHFVRKSHYYDLQ